MRRITLAALVAALLLLVPSVLLAVDIDSDGAGGSPWTALGTGGDWASTPTSVDDLTVIDDHYIQQSGDITVNSLTIDGDNAVFELTPGYTLTVTEFLHVKNGTFRAMGDILMDARVLSIDYNAASMDITMDGSIGNLAAGDMIFVMDDDPANPKGTVSGQVHVGDGHTPGLFRSSNAKWKALHILSVSGSTLTVLYDFYEDTTVGYSGTYAANAYLGSRAPTVLTGAGATLAAAPVRRDDGTSYFDLLEATADACTVTGDLGEQYVRWTTGACAGREDKILHCDNDTPGAGTDRYYFGSDLSSCGASEFETTIGLRAGDRIVGFRPPVIDGAATGSIILDFYQGTVEMSWFSARRLGPYAMSGHTPAGSSVCSVCLINTDSATADTSASSFVKNGEVGFTTSGSTDTAIFGQMNQSATSAPLGGALWDASSLTLDRLYVHDQVNDTAGTGNHGFFGRSPHGFTVTRSRVERLQDDLFGATLYDLDGTDAMTLDFASMIGVAQLPNAGHSHECFNVAHASVTEALLQQDVGSEASNILVTGCGQRSMDVHLLGSTFSGVVVGGSGDTAAGVGAQVNIGSSAWPDTYSSALIDTTPNTVSNSLFYPYAATGTGTPRYVIAGSLNDSVAYRHQLTAQQQIDSVLSGCQRSAIYINGNSNGFINAQTNALGANTNTSVDCVYSASRPDAPLGVTRLMNSVVTETNGAWQTLNWTRIYALTSDVSTSGGFMHIGFDTAPLTANVTDSTFTKNDGTGRGGWGTPGVATFNYSGNCSEQEGAGIPTNAYAYGSAWTYTSGNRQVRGLGINADSGAPLRSYLQDVSAPCGHARPTALGLSALAPSHALLGDNFLLQLDAVSSRELAPVGSGGGGGGGGQISW